MNALAAGSSAGEREQRGRPSLLMSSLAGAPLASLVSSALVAHGVNTRLQRRIYTHAIRSLAARGSQTSADLTPILNDILHTQDL